MRQWNNCQNSNLQDSKNRHKWYCWSSRNSMWVAEDAQSIFIKIKEWRICYRQYLNLQESENKHECYCWLFRNSMLMLLKKNLENTIMHSKFDVMHCMKKWSNSTTRTLLLKEKIIVRTQIYESQNSSENKEQTWKLFLNAIIEFSNENLSLWESKHWVYEKLYCRFSETSSLREFLSSILRNSESTRVQVAYKS